VATDCQSGPRELLSDGAGVLVPVDSIGALSDAIVEMLTDLASAACCASAARRSAEGFDLASATAKWRKLVEDVTRR
jgi:glycosyltransferase involved in cell wall biosynthesis